MKLQTPENSSFRLERIEDKGLTIRVGLTGKRIELSTRAFADVLHYLGEWEWVLIGASHGPSIAGTIEEIVKRHTNGTSAASYLVPILVKAGMIELDPRRPARVRIIRS